MKFPWTKDAPTGPEQPTLPRVLDENDVVEVLDNGVIIVTPKSGLNLAESRELAVREGSSIDLRDLGNSSPSPYFGRFEYNNAWRGWNGIKKADEMRRSDGSIGGVLDLVKTPVLGARWFIEPHHEPGREPTARDINAANHIWWNLTEGMSTSWPQFLGECLLMLDYGYYCFEKVFTVSHPLRPGMACWKKFNPWHPLDITEWDYDENGGPNGIIVQRQGRIPDPPISTRPSNQSVMVGYGRFPGRPLGNVEQFIAIDKLLAFTYKKEGNDMAGMSLLRPAFKHWYMKQNLEKIDAIQKERHGIGVPIIKLPVNFSLGDKNLAEQMGRNLRTNERAHIVLPPMWEIMFAKLEGQPVDTLKSIDYHDRMIWTRVLARFMAQNNTIKDDDRILFLQATRIVADVVMDVINKYAIPQLVDYNWARISGYPKLRARRIGEQADWRTMTFALRNAIGAGAITPDDRLEDSVREEMDLPRRDPATARNQKTPQAAPNAPENANGDKTAAGQVKKPEPPHVGPPRQTKPSATPPRNNGGNDVSGG
jgi:hypothetical protein